MRRLASRDTPKEEKRLLRQLAAGEWIDAGPFIARIVAECEAADGQH
jgi:hypothetical protein